MMLASPRRTIPLRASLLADAVVCAATGTLMLAAEGPLADLLDLPTTLLRGAGLAIVPYVAFLMVILRRDPVPAEGVRAAIAINIAWAVGCIAVLLSGRVETNALGIAFTLLQAAVVLVFAEVEALGLRKT